MPLDYGHDLFWDVISSDQDAKAHRELVVHAKQAATPYWDFLAAALSESEFEHRLALVQPEVEHKVASVVTAAEYLDKLSEVRTEVLSSLQSDWSDLNQLRRTEAARRIESMLRIEANENVVELPKQFVHIMASKAGPDESYEVAHVASPEFAKTLSTTGSQDEALATARQFTATAPMPIYFNGRYVEGHLTPKAHDYFDASLGRWVHVPAKTAYIDPDDKRRYDRYPVGDAQVASGGSVLSPTPGPSAAGGQVTETSTGPDGFPADMAYDEGRSAGAYAFQTTPQPWTVTPGSEWREDTTPNAATGQVTPSRHGSRRTASDDWGWERSTSDDFNGDRDRDQYKCPDCGEYNVVERARCQNCGEDRPKSVTNRHREGARRQASEGIAGGPTGNPVGYNPNYFSQGTTGVTGPDAYSTDPTPYEPIPAPHQDTTYDAPDGGVSQGTGGSDGTSDGRGYSPTTAARRCMRAGCTKQAHVAVPHQTLGSWDLCGEDFAHALKLNPRTAAFALDDPAPLHWRREAARQRPPFGRSAEEREDDEDDADDETPRTPAPATPQPRTRGYSKHKAVRLAALVRQAAFLRVVPGAEGRCDVCGNQATHQLHVANEGSMQNIGKVCEPHAREYNEHKLSALAARSADHLKDYRIVGQCDNCHSPVRWHGDAQELRHLHSNDNRCDGSNSMKATASARVEQGRLDRDGPCVSCGGPADVMLRHVSDRDGTRNIGPACDRCAGHMARTAAMGDTNVPTPTPEDGAGQQTADSNVPQDPQQQHMARRVQAVGIETPTAENPTGRGADEYRARNFDTLIKQRPMQSLEDRNINTPTLPQDPIKVLDTDGPRERDDRDDNDAGQRNASLRTIAELMEI